MKNVLLLSGILLSVSGAYAAEQQRDLLAEGKKRNEQAYEQVLEKTGWKGETAPQAAGSHSLRSRETNRTSSQPKSS